MTEGSGGGQVLRRQAPNVGIAFAIAIAVWLVFYYRFPAKPLGKVEFLFVWMAAHVLVLGARMLIRRLRRRSSDSPGEGGEND